MPLVRTVQSFFEPRQPLCDLNPFDSVFLIRRRVVSAPGLFHAASRASPPPYATSVESLFLVRYSATALAEERAFPLGIPTLVGGLIVSPEQHQQQ